VTKRGPRQPNAERKAQTRAELLSAASAVVARRGDHTPAVDEVASEAGYSAGALYAHFGSKEQLFLDLVEEHLAYQIQRYTDAAAEPGDGVGDIDERAHAGATEWIDYLEREPEYFQVFISFWDYAVRDKKLRPLLAERFAQLRQVTGQLIAAGAEARGVHVEPEVADQLALFVTSLGNGIALQRQADPDSVPPDFFGTMLAQIFSALAAEAQRALDPASA
jgi:AcrR family transcriptional regulator